MDTKVQVFVHSRVGTDFLNVLSRLPVQAGSLERGYFLRAVSNFFPHSLQNYTKNVSHFQIQNENMLKLNIFYVK